VPEWITAAIESPTGSILILPALVILGAISALTSGCNLAVLGAISSYAGAQKSESRRGIWLAAIAFVIGCMIILAAIGAIIGLAGQEAGLRFGFYGQMAAGFISILIGFLTLGWIPLPKLPKFNPEKALLNRGAGSALLMGLALGAASISCAISCANPAMLTMLGAVALQGAWLKGLFFMCLFGLGYGLPLAALMLGVGTGADRVKSARVHTVLKYSGGMLLITIGFYFLLTLK
jgi:cytochrome c biogenesis protein CcdA